MIASRHYGFLFLLGLVSAQQYTNVHPRGETFPSSRQFPSQYASTQQQQVYNSYQNQQQPNYYQQQPNYQQGINRNPQRPQGTQNRQGPNYNQQPQRQQSVLSTRFNEMQGDDPNSSFNADFTTRTPPKKVVQTTDLPSPPAFDTRFDNYTTRKISWDGELSRNAEIFSLKLLAYVESLNQNKNFMISPFSIHSLLVMIAEGAEGNTFEEINQALGLKTKERARDFHQYISKILKSNSADVAVSLFSAMVGDRNRPIGREYEDTVEKVFDVDYIPVNFIDVDKTLYDVNSEVSRKTNGQIQQALTRDELYKAQLILLSGIHFQGSWKSVFNASHTKPAQFFDYKNERALGNVKMMFQRGNFAYTAIQDLGAYVLELPYAPAKNTRLGVNSANSDPNSVQYDDRISMIFVLPKKGQELFTTIDNINKYGMERLFKELKKVKEEYEDDEVEVFIPRFETTTSLNLVEALENMEIHDLFDQSVANLNKINTNYFVSSILHKSKIRVDEKGTEASAITTSIFQNKATPPVFNANRPFIYFIVDKAARLILFAGVYEKPEFF